MREFAVTPRTSLNLLLTGMRIRLNKTTAQLAQLLGVPGDRLHDLEADDEAVKQMPVGEFIEIMDKMGVRLIAQATTMSGPAAAPRELVDNDPQPEPQPEPAPPAPVSGPSRTVYVSNPDALAYALRRAWLRTGKTKAQCCAEMGISAGTFSRHVAHGGNATIDFLGAYARYFNLEFVIGEEPDALT